MANYVLPDLKGYWVMAFYEYETKGGFGRTILLSLVAPIIAGGIVFDMYNSPGKGLAIVFAGYLLIFIAITILYNLNIAEWRKDFKCIFNVFKD